MDTNTVTSPEARAGRREWIGLAVLALPTLLLSLDMGVLFLALPQLGAELGASATQQLWITDIYGFMIAGFLITMGTLGDRIGRRKLLMIGGAAFGVASVIAAYSTSAQMLIGTRALLGVAGATLMPSTLALISNMFRNPQQRGVAIGAWMSCFVGGTAIGPIVGGALLEHFWWGSAFLLGVPVMALLLVTAPLLLPEYRDPQAGRLDLTSVALSLAAILPIIYAIKELAKDGWQPLPILAIAVGVGFGVVFMRRQGRLSSPLLDLRLFRNRTFSTALLIGLVGGATMGGTFLFVSQYLQLVEGLSPLRAGLWMVPSTLAMIAASMLAPVIAQRIRPGMVIAAGLAISTVGFGLLTQVGSAGGLAVLVVGFAIASAGIAPPASLGTGLVVGSAPPEKAGSASSMSETSSEFGIALGLAALGSVGAAVYRSQMTVPAEVPAEAAGVARESAAGAISAGQDLPGPLGVELMVTASEAFTNGLNTVAAVSATVLAALAILAVALLRHIRPDPQPTEVAGTAEQPEATPVAAEVASVPEPVEPARELVHS